jgi:hypothetical protein
VTPKAECRVTPHSPQCASWPGRPPIVQGELPPLLGRTQIGIRGPGALAPGSRQAGSDLGKEGQPSAVQSPSAAKEGVENLLKKERPFPQAGF